MERQFKKTTEQINQQFEDCEISAEEQFTQLREAERRLFGKKAFKAMWNLDQPLPSRPKADSDGSTVNSKTNQLDDKRN